MVKIQRKLQLHNPSVKILINSLLAPSFQPVISSVMSIKGGFSSSSDFSPCFASFTKGVSVKELGFGGLFGRIWVDVTFLASTDNAWGELGCQFRGGFLCTRNGIHLCSISYVCIGIWPEHQNLLL